MGGCGWGASAPPRLIALLKVWLPSPTLGPVDSFKSYNLSTADSNLPSQHLTLVSYVQSFLHIPGNFLHHIILILPHISLIKYTVFLGHANSVSCSLLWDMDHQFQVQWSGANMVFLSIDAYANKLVEIYLSTAEFLYECWFLASHILKPILSFWLFYLLPAYTLVHRAPLCLAFKNIVSFFLWIWFD